MTRTAQIIHRTSPTGRQMWRLRRQLHRLDGPAIIHPNGTEEWYLHGVRHRADGPAIVHSNGMEEWYLHGVLHREDGPAIMDADGAEIWYWENLIHREGGPAITHGHGVGFDWLQHDKLHRLDGPASIMPGHPHMDRWYVNDVKVDDEVEEFFERHELPRWDALDETGRVMLQLFLSGL